MIRSPAIGLSRISAASSGVSALFFSRIDLGDGEQADVLELGGEGDVVDLLSGEVEAAADRDRPVDDDAQVLAELGPAGCEHGHQDGVCLAPGGAVLALVVGGQPLAGDLQRAVGVAGLVGDRDLAVGTADRQVPAFVVEGGCGGDDDLSDLAVAGGDQHGEPAVFDPVGRAAERRRRVDEHLGAAAQQVVAGGVAEAVVVGVQPVEVEEQQDLAVAGVARRSLRCRPRGAGGC